MSKEESVHLISDDVTLAVTGYGVQRALAVEAIELKDKTGRRCRGWCRRTCIVIAVGVVLFLIAAAVAGIIAAAVDNGMYHHNIIYDTMLFIT